MTINSWQKLSKFLTQFPDMSLQIGQLDHAPDFSLDNMRALASKLGHPQKDFPSIHVAGTNGKGSVVSICASVLSAANYKVGQYTSPHYGEMLAGIKINGQIIELSNALQIMAKLEKITPSIPDLTLFEIETMMAFLYFSHEQVDIGVIEVGLGGLLDATNIIDPILTVITSIDLEHQAVLGSTLAEIAKHKAGILHSGAPLMLAAQKDDGRQIILDEANRKNVDVVEMGLDLRVEAGHFNQTNQSLHINFKEKQEQLTLGMLGRFQLENGALAYAALQELENFGFPISPLEFQQGFLSARWPGRFEIIEAMGRTFILDAAHTSSAAQILAQSLEDYFPKTNLIGIIGISDDKALNKILSPFQGKIKTLIATQSKHPRAMDRHSLVEQIVENGFEGLHSVSSPEAIDMAVQKSQKGQVILVFGSLFLIDELRTEIQSRK